MKLIEYGGGVVELRTYSEVVGNKPINMPEELLIAKQLVARIHNQLKEHTVYNPFEEEEMGLYDLDEMEIATQRKKHSARNSYSRTVQQIYKYARQCNWEYFITLTYEKDKVESRYDFKECMKKANKWIQNQRARYAPDLQYILVPEMHKDGAWHIHGLVAQCGAMRFADTGHVHHTGRKTLNVSDWPYGRITHAVEVDDTARISGYITKYITKELCVNTEGQKRYFRSRNIPEPKETEFLVEGNQKKAFAEMLADSLGIEEQYSKEIGGYTSVKYQYFKREVKQ